MDFKFSFQALRCITVQKHALLISMQKFIDSSQFRISAVLILIWQASAFYNSYDIIKK